MHPSVYGPYRPRADAVHTQSAHNPALLKGVGCVLARTAGSITC